MNKLNINTSIGTIIRVFKKQGGDCCASYDITYKDSINNTVDSFIKNVIEQYPDEWGYININPYDCYSETGCVEYNNGRIIKDTMSDKQKASIIKTITGYGGWSAFDYNISIK